ncbi:DNA-3-methyladenine glycosylase [Knoellia sp. p5-6-4]|uniref:DNA-3-methyladenine glycosylase family protein n=1 Tax=unclassified Knoellia TaxID=2618719 RepID=UPI0023DB9250|nr:DNA-3-methyladenine glycosylase 2 family protein [Knoellia sp. p5-6-4]MDF2146449.1 DNA-3-methyladenine glycosylase 2 family protein [Knoellia sp. p5-6-4]
MSPSRPPARTPAPDPAPDPAPGVERVWRPRRPVSLGAILTVFRRGSGDPTFETDQGQGWWLGLPTTLGPATLRLQARPTDDEVVARAWGPGAQWVLDQVPALLGDGDDADGFVAHHPQVARARAQYAGWHVPRSGLVMHALVPAVIEQKVTGQEAFSAQRVLVRRYGQRAPGPGAARGLWVAPDARAWAAIPSWEWLRASVDGARSGTAVRAAQRAGRLEEAASLGLEEAHRRLRSIPGIGVWTAAEVAQRALGDPDSVSFGDYHVAKNITWALTGEALDDDACAELLEPYAGHRYRVQRLLELDGAVRPRRGPRMAPRRHLPTRPR